MLKCKYEINKLKTENRNLNKGSETGISFHDIIIRILLNKIGIYIDKIQMKTSTYP